MADTLEQEPVSILELLLLILFLGSITFLIGALFQGIVLFRNRKPVAIGFLVILITRMLTIISSYFIWAAWTTRIDIMFLFLFLPGLIAELVFSPLMLKLSGNHIFKNK